MTGTRRGLSSLLGRQNCRILIRLLVVFNFFGFHWLRPTPAVTRGGDRHTLYTSYSSLLFAAAWSTEGLADEEENDFQSQELGGQGAYTPLESSRDAASAGYIGAGASALMHASHLGASPYGGPLEENDEDREAFVPSVDRTESRLQQIEQGAKDLADDDAVDAQHHDLPPPPVYSPQEDTGERYEETGAGIQPEEPPEHTSPWVGFMRQSLHRCPFYSFAAGASILGRCTYVLCIYLSVCTV